MASRVIQEAQLDSVSASISDRLRRTDERVSDRYHEFALSLLDTIAETVGQDQVRTILRK